jgi:ApaG protein
MRRPLYHAITRGIRVTVRPVYLPEQSRPAQGHFVFAYFVRVENVGPETVQLVRRRWIIEDANGVMQEIEGEGVVGEQPVLPPGAVHEYQSFCPLRAPRGSMHGSYRFRVEGGSDFDARIPRFELDAEPFDDARRPADD